MAALAAQSEKARSVVRMVLEWFWLAGCACVTKDWYRSHSHNTVDTVVFGESGWVVQSRYQIGSANMRTVYHTIAH
jgi:hypothetical protein